MPRITALIPILCVTACLVAEVEVTEETVTHPMWIAPMEEDRPYPKTPSRDELKQLYQNEKNLKKSLEHRLLEDNPKLKEDKKARREALREALGRSKAYQRAREKIRAARAKYHRKIDHKFPLITLDNGRIRVKIAPTLGMRVVNAVDLETGRSLANTPDPKYYETEPFRDIIGWTAGYVETSFPYFEHGMYVRQSAGYRIVKGAGGEVTVAMNCRFTHFQHKREMGRYGHYSQRPLSVWVTLKPDEARYRLTTRLENPNPLRRAERIWTNHLMHVDEYSGEQIIYPAGYIMPHNGGWAKPFYAEGGRRGWRGVSWFALYPEWGFCGVYAPKDDFNSLITKDPQACPGMKLYTRNDEGGFLELWTGSTTLFEYPGDFRPPYVPVQYAQSYYGVSGAGRVVFANEHVAVGHDGKRYTLTAPQPARARVEVHPTGKLLGEGPVGPGKNPVTFELPKEGTEVRVKLNAEQRARVRLPLTFTDEVLKRHAKVNSLGGKFRVELEENTNHVGAPTVRHAVRQAKGLLATDGKVDIQRVISTANACYRLGRFDLVDKLLVLAGDAPDADYLRGLVAWERGKKVDFGDAGLESYYHRALLAIRDGETEAAVEWLDKLIDKRPAVYRPRLLRACLTKNAKAANALAGENPASPEAQLVRELLDLRDAAGEKEKLLRHNPGAAEQVEAFREELTKGEWQHVRRYELTTR